jgi:hypothetical protein
VRVNLIDNENKQVLAKVAVKNGVEELRKQLTTFNINEADYEFYVDNTKI